MTKTDSKILPFPPTHTRCVQVFRGPVRTSQKHVPSGKIVHRIPIVHLWSVGRRRFLVNLDSLINKKKQIKKNP